MSEGMTVAFSGYLGQDATLRWTQGGQALCQFSVLVADSKRKDDETPRWVRVTLWGEEGEQLAPKLLKGSEAHVLGRHRISHWQDKITGADRQGEEVTATAVDLLGAAALRSRSTAVSPRREGAMPQSMAIPRTSRAEL